MEVYTYMATILSIDPALIERALAVSGERTKKDVVTKAFQEFIARREQPRRSGVVGQLPLGAYLPLCNSAVV